MLEVKHLATLDAGKSKTFFMNHAAVPNQCVSTLNFSSSSLLFALLSNRRDAKIKPFFSLLLGPMSKNWVGFMALFPSRELLQLKFVHNAQYCFWDSWKMVPMNKKIVKQRIFVWCCAANCQDFFKTLDSNMNSKTEHYSLLLQVSCWNSATLESFIRMTLHNCWQIWCQHRKWILFCQNEFSRQPSQKCERILPLVALVMGMFSRVNCTRE